MVERYHELDGPVLREILGKKITSKTRKDLDDASEHTRVPLRSCHRQYDNIRRYTIVARGKFRLDRAFATPVDDFDFGATSAAFHPAATALDSGRADVRHPPSLSFFCCSQSWFFPFDI